MAVCLLVSILTAASWAQLVSATDLDAAPSRQGAITYLPGLLRDRRGCTATPWETYGSLIPDSPPTDRPASQHGDINLALRGYEPIGGHVGLVDYSGDTDERAPQLPGLFADRRTPAFVRNLRARDWNWGCNCRGAPLTSPVVTTLGLGTTPGESIHLPITGQDMGFGYEALVLYADHNRITIKYTREDNVVAGYTLHIEGICVEPALLSLYDTLNDAGRPQLPALRPGQGFARAHGSEILIAIRDSGRFMDPRSRKDWWRGR